MNYTLLGFCSNIFGFVVGGISLLGLIITTFKPHLPSNKIRELETLLEETEKTLKEAVEEGVLVHELAQVAEHRLILLKIDARDLRSRAYTVTTLRQDYAEFFRGTSSAIGSTYNSLRRLRAQVITSSEERRRRLIEMGPVLSSITTRPPHLQIDLEVDTPTPASEISQPNTCPAMLPTWISIDQAAQGDHFDDSRKIDSDVRTTDAPYEASALHTSVNLEPEA